MRKFGTHKFIYDSWNRIQSMTYPDGEVVTYTYDRGGMLQSVQGRKGMNHLTYVENTTYNAYGLKESVLYGNGTYTEYQYDLLMRLSHLYSENGQGEAMQDIEYKYDSVDNITDIYNNAPMLLNGLGGDYWSHNDYDDLYRLSHAEGNWNGGQLNYHLDMQYHSNGRIERKKMYAEVMDHTGDTSVTNYENGYLYNVGQPNTLEYVVDDFSGWQQIFTWDAAGNMTNHENFAEGCIRSLCWDEQNRLVSFADCENAGFYQYDANGERTYKLAGGIAMQNIQGHWRSYNLLDNPTLYTSPYLVSTPKGYTKHYYAENERVASRIGGGGLGMISVSIVELDTFSAKKEANVQHAKAVTQCLTDKDYKAYPLLEGLYYWKDIIQAESDCYWYHSDHLGSSSWITFSDGEAIQHLHYLPWGENFVDQRSSTFDGARFTFSAKEKDAETGYSYFGARYYSSDLSIWLSVDPMSDKYPSLSPYVYCANNPIKLVDPNGEEIGEYRDWNGILLGTDGIDDLNVYFVSDENSIDIIRNNDASGKTTNRSDVKIDWETNKIETHTIVSVYDMTVNNGGNREEAATFPGKSRLPKFYPTGGDDGEIEIDSKGYLSIHSHKLNYFDCPDGTGTCVQTPHNLSDKDKAVFPNYNYNVVVGNSYQSVSNFSTGTVYRERLGTAVIYDSGKNKIGEIRINNLRQINFF